MIKFTRCACTSGAETSVELYSRTVDHKGVRKKRPLAMVLLLHIEYHRSQGERARMY